MAACLLALTCVETHAQTAVNELEARIAQLESFIRASGLQVPARKDVVDTWSNLTGLEDQADGGISSLDDMDKAEQPDLMGREAVIGARLLAIAPRLQTPYNGAILDRMYFYMQSPWTKVAHRRFEKNRGYFEDIFRKYDVPEELAALSIVESAVSTNAVSQAGAVGVWQLMPATASDYGLQADEVLDERKDMEKSTVAAAKFLRDLHRSLGDWNLAVLAYNCGLGNVRKAIIRSGASHDIWHIMDFLPKETQAYLPSLLATVYLLNYPDMLIC